MYELDLPNIRSGDVDALRALREALEPGGSQQLSMTGTGFVEMGNALLDLAGSRTRDCYQLRRTVEEFGHSARAWKLEADWWRGDRDAGLPEGWEWDGPWIVKKLDDTEAKVRGMVGECLFWTVWVHEFGGPREIENGSCNTWHEAMNAAEAAAKGGLSNGNAE